jgi:aldehyde dehydrogenase (NAD+)
MDARAGIPAGKEALAALQSMGIEALAGGDAAPPASPIDESLLPRMRESSVQDVQRAIGAAREAFLAWRSVPAPVRGELIRLFGQKLRMHKSALGRLITLEVGKPLSEGMGEVQEMIDICDFAVGLSRQLYGLTIASERADHHMREVWQPVGPVGIISAFNSKKGSFERRCVRKPWRGSEAIPRRPRQSPAC